VDNRSHQTNEDERDSPCRPSPTRSAVQTP
jgi:hypothetical protein